LVYPGLPGYSPMAAPPPLTIGTNQVFQAVNSHAVDAEVENKQISRIINCDTTGIKERRGSTDTIDITGVAATGKRRHHARRRDLLNPVVPVIGNEHTSSTVDGRTLWVDKRVGP
jgi:hypothetical protein